MPSPSYTVADLQDMRLSHNLPESNLTIIRASDRGNHESKVRL
jgi:hypothetical protein